MIHRAALPPKKPDSPLLAGLCLLLLIAVIFTSWRNPQPAPQPAVTQRQIDDLQEQIDELVDGFEACKDGYDHLRPDVNWCKGQIDKQRGRLECLDVRVTGLEEQAAEAKVWEAYYHDYWRYLTDWLKWFNRQPPK